MFVVTLNIQKAGIKISTECGAHIADRIDALTAKCSHTPLWPDSRLSSEVLSRTNPGEQASPSTAPHFPVCCSCLGSFAFNAPTASSASRPMPTSSCAVRGPPGRSTGLAGPDQSENIADGGAQLYNPIIQISTLYTYKCDTPGPPLLSGSLWVAKPQDHQL